MALMKIAIAWAPGTKAIPIGEVSRIEILDDDDDEINAVVYLPDTVGGRTLTVRSIEPVLVWPDPSPGEEPIDIPH